MRDVASGIGGATWTTWQPSGGAFMKLTARWYLAAVPRTARMTDGSLYSASAVMRSDQESTLKNSAGRDRTTRMRRAPLRYAASAGTGSETPPSTIPLPSTQPVEVHDGPAARRAPHVDELAPRHELEVAALVSAVLTGEVRRQIARARGDAERELERVERRFEEGVENAGGEDAAHGAAPRPRWPHAPS
jgi:hypothetical protein